MPYFTWRRRDIYYAKRGWGDPLLLVHNLYPGASHEEWEHNLSALAQHHTVYAIDLLGFGQSDAPRLKYTAAMYVELLRDFLQERIGQKCHVMSAGLSCAYVSEVASAWPELVDKLVYVCPRSEPTGLDTPRWFAPIRQALMTTVGSSFYETLASRYELATYLINSYADPKHVRPDLIERLHEYANRPESIYAYASLLNGFLDSSILKHLPRVTSPLMLIWGREAKPTPVEHSVRLTSIARDCRLKIVEHAGSWVHHECSARVNTLVQDFLT